MLEIVDPGTFELDPVTQLAGLLRDLTEAVRDEAREQGRDLLPWSRLGQAVAAAERGEDGLGDLRARLKEAEQELRDTESELETTRDDLDEVECDLSTTLAKLRRMQTEEIDPLRQALQNLLTEIVEANPAECGKRFSPLAQAIEAARGRLS